MKVRTCENLDDKNYKANYHPVSGAGTKSERSSFSLVAGLFLRGAQKEALLARVGNGRFAKERGNWKRVGCDEKRYTIHAPDSVERKKKIIT